MRLGEGQAPPTLLPANPASVSKRKVGTLKESHLLCVLTCVSSQNKETRLQPKEEHARAQVYNSLAEIQNLNRNNAYL